MGFMANQFLGLSLFVMLLSFFIILNGLSNFEDEKSKPVLGSLALAFSFKELAAIDEEPTTMESVEESTHEGDVLSNIDELFQARIEGVKTQKNRLGTIMHISMPFEEFEKGILIPDKRTDGKALESEGFFLPTLISLLRARDDIPYRMDMVLNISESPSKVQSENPSVMHESLAEIAAIAQQLEESGLPKKLVTAGLGAGKEKNIDLYFRRYEPFNPMGDAPPGQEPQGHEQVK